MSRSDAEFPIVIYGHSVHVGLQEVMGSDRRPEGHDWHVTTCYVQIFTRSAAHGRLQFEVDYHRTRLTADIIGRISVNL